MSIPTEGYPLTAAVSPRVHVIESVDSTNAKLLHDVEGDPDAHPHLSLLVTRDHYVACDPVALARDVGAFRERGYGVRRIEAFDLFPHSHHVEAVALLQREP